MEEDKIVLPRINHFLSLYEYNERFRMSPEAMEAQLQDIGHYIEHPSGKSGALTSKQ